MTRLSSIIGEEKEMDFLDLIIEYHKDKERQGPGSKYADAFLYKYNHTDNVIDFIEEVKIEADMYNRFKDYYSYVFYIAKKK